MSIAWVQDEGSISFGVTVKTVTLTGVGAGNTLLAFTGWLSDTITLDSLTDDNGGSWTEVENPTTETTQGRGAGGHAVGAAAGDTIISATFSASISPELHVFEFSGDSPEFADSAGNPQTNPGTGTDAVTTGDLVTTTSSGAFVGASFDVQSGNPPAIGTGFILNVSPSFGTSEYRISVAAETDQATFTAANAFLDTVSIGIAIQEAAAASNPKGPLGMPLGRPLQGPIPCWI